MEKREAVLPTSLNAYYAVLPAALYMCNTRSRDVNHRGNSVSRSGAGFLPPGAPLCALVALVIVSKDIRHNYREGSDVTPARRSSAEKATGVLLLICSVYYNQRDSTIDVPRLAHTSAFAYAYRAP